MRTTLLLSVSERAQVANELYQLRVERARARTMVAANQHLDHHDHDRYVEALEREIRRHEELLR